MQVDLCCPQVYCPVCLREVAQADLEKGRCETCEAEIIVGSEACERAIVVYRVKDQTIGFRWDSGRTISANKAQQILRMSTAGVVQAIKRQLIRPLERIQWRWDIPVEEVRRYLHNRARRWKP